MELKAACQIKLNGKYIMPGERFEVDAKTGDGLLKRERAVRVGERLPYEPIAAAIAEQQSKEHTE